VFALNFLIVALAAVSLSAFKITNLSVCVRNNLTNCGYILEEIT